MAGSLQSPPSTHELERMYHELSRHGAPAVGRKRRWRYRTPDLESCLALAGEMLRYDARLLSILLQLVLQAHPRINPRALRSRMAEMRRPQALLVVFEFARLADPDPELRYMAEYLGHGVPRVQPAERFFVDAAAAGSRIAVRQRGRSLAPYTRWGFIGHERPTADAFTKRTVGRLDARSRRQVLEDLLDRTHQVSLSDYLAAVDHGISRQQALQDLRRAGLDPVGRGRAARWRRPAPEC